MLMQHVLVQATREGRGAYVEEGRREEGRRLKIEEMLTCFAIVLRGHGYLLLQVVAAGVCR